MANAPTRLSVSLNSDRVLNPVTLSLSELVLLISKHSLPTKTKSQKFDTFWLFAFVDYCMLSRMLFDFVCWHGPIIKGEGSGATVSIHTANCENWLTLTFKAFT